MAEYQELIHIFWRYCNYIRDSENGCNNCRFNYMNFPDRVGCVDFIVRHPGEAEEFLTAWAVDHPEHSNTCTMCGKPLDDFDNQENFGFEYQIGYGSRHDGEHVKAQFCCECWDNILDLLIDKCKTNPIVGAK